MHNKGMLYTVSKQLSLGQFQTIQEAKEAAMKWKRYHSKLHWHEWESSSQSGLDAPIQSQMFRILIYEDYCLLAITTSFDGHYLYLEMAKDRAESESDTRLRWHSLCDRWVADSAQDEIYEIHEVVASLNWWQETKQTVQYLRNVIDFNGSYYTRSKSAFTRAAGHGMQSHIDHFERPKRNVGQCLSRRGYR